MTTWTHKSKNSTTWKSTTDFLLQELGDFLLQENGGKIVLQQSKRHKNETTWTYKSK